MTRPDLEREYSRKEPSADVYVPDRGYVLFHHGDSVGTNYTSEEWFRYQALEKLKSIERHLATIAAALQARTKE